MLKTEQKSAFSEPSNVSGSANSPAIAPKRRNWLASALLWFTTLLFLFTAIGFVAFRFWVWPELQRWQPEVEAQLSKALGTKVSVESLTPTIRGVYPSVIATNLSTADGALSLARVEMEFSPRALMARQVLFRNLSLDSGQIRIKVDEKGFWNIAGLVFDPADRSVMDEASRKKMSEALRWVFQQRLLKLTNVSVLLENQPIGRQDRLKVSEVVLSNVGRSHTFKAISNPGGTLHATWQHPLGTASDLTKQWFGNMSWDIGGVVDANGAQTNAIKGELLSYLLRTAQAVKNLPVLDQISGLTFQGKIEATFAKGIIDAVRLSNVSVSSSKLLSTAVTPLVKLQRVSGQDFEVQSQDIAIYGFESLSGLRLGVNRPSSIFFHWGSEELGAEFATLHSADVQLGALDLAAAASAVRHWSSAQSVLDMKPLLTQFGINQWQLAGRVRGAKVNWNEAKDQLSGEFDAEQISLLGVDRSVGNVSQVSLDRPGFERIGGKITFEKIAASNDFSGNYEITGNNSRLVLPGVLVEPDVKLTKLGGKGKWQWFRNAEAQPEHIFELKFEQFAFENTDGLGSLQGVYRASRQLKKPGYADLTGKLDKAVGVRLASYLPLRMPEGTRTWLSKGIKAGDATDATFKVKGDLWHFPFNEPGTGEFSIFAKLKNAQFAFAPNWAELEELSGEFFLDKTSVRVKGSSAKILGVGVSNFLVDVPDIRDGIVKITGKADGSIASMLSFVNNGPLKWLTVKSENPGVRAFTESLKIEGPAQLTLAIELPIYDFTGVKVQGLVALSNGQLSSLHTPDLRSVEGGLAFTEKNLELKALSGKYGDASLGQAYPLTVSGISDSNLPLSVKVSGVATSDVLKKLPLLEGVMPILKGFSGAAEFESAIEINREAFKVQVQSSLQGMALDMPAPVGKAAEQIRGFRLSYSPTSLIAGLRAVTEVPDPDSPQVEFKVSRIGTAAKDEWFGGLSIGRSSDEPMADATEGLSAVVKTSRLNINEWEQWLSNTFPSIAEEKASAVAQQTYIGLPSFMLSGSALKVSHLALVADELAVDDLFFKDTVLGANLVWQPFEVTSNSAIKRPTLMSWSASVLNNQANGYINWVADSSSNNLYARMAKLQWPLVGKDLEQAKTAALSKPVSSSLPSLNVESEDFSLHGVQLGKLKLRSDATQPNTYQVSEVSVALPEFIVRGQGAWRKDNNQSRFSMAATTQDAGALLTLTGQPGILKSGPGEIKGDIRWNGNVDTFAFNRVSGNVTLELGKGQFLKTDVGAARMLGLFSVQGLVRRLNLDFRDVLSDGFAFDSIAGPIEIINGIASPDDVLIKSPIAQISFKGQLDIAKRTQDLKLKVVPEVNAGAASLAYAAWVNPAIGLGSFLFQWALRKPLQSIFTTEYSVSGPWDQPLIKGLDRKLSQYGIVPSE
jgi:uncharacterized protein YhdP